MKRLENSSLFTLNLLFGVIILKFFSCYGSQNSYSVFEPKVVYQAKKFCKESIFPALQRKKGKKRCEISHGHNLPFICCRIPWINFLQPRVWFWNTVIMWTHSLTCIYFLNQLNTRPLKHLHRSLYKRFQLIIWSHYRVPIPAIVFLSGYWTACLIHELT